MRVFVMARHGESVLNLERRINGDPTQTVDLTERGRLEAAQLGQQVQEWHVDVCLHSRFPRTEQTARIALEGRDVRFEVEPLFDDIDVGDLEGSRIEDYREWKHGHPRSEAFPGGESLNDAAARYALNGAAGSSSLDGPAHEIANAAPYLFDEDGLSRAAAGIEAVLATVPA